MKKYTIGSLLTNTYLVDSPNSKDCFLVDPSLDLLKVLEEIKEYNIQFILLTHGHVDHIDGIRYFNSPIYLHEKEVPFLTDDSLSLYKMFHMKSNFPPLDLHIVHDGDEINFNDEKIKVLHTPGHTCGSVCYLYKNKLFSGDTLFEQGCGRTDFPTGNEKMMNESLVKIIDNLDDNITVYPGHGNKTSIKDEKKNNMYYLLAKKRSTNK